jgi:hypothetical protein
MRTHKDKKRGLIEMPPKQYGPNAELRSTRGALADFDPEALAESVRETIKEAADCGDAAALPLLSGSLVLVAPRQTLLGFVRWLHLDLKQVSKLDGQELVLCLHDSISKAVTNRDLPSVPLLSGWFALLLSGRALVTFAVGLEREGDDRGGDGRGSK